MVFEGKDRQTGNLTQATENPDSIYCIKDFSIRTHMEINNVGNSKDRLI